MSSCIAGKLEGLRAKCLRKEKTIDNFAQYVKNRMEYNRKIIENAQRQKSTDAGKEKLTMKYNRSKIHAT